MITPLELISPSYRSALMALHGRQHGWGTGGFKWATTVEDLIRKHRASSVLDYGCGTGTLARQLRAAGIRGLRVDEYDPAIPGKDHLPSFADLVVCTDVLEHIEPDRLDVVIEHLKVLARKAIFVVVSTRAANILLPGGENAHLTIQPAEWWEDKLKSAGFSARPLHDKREKELAVVLTP